MNFVPSAVKAEEWGISQRRVAILCKEGRVPGAELVGNRWFCRLMLLSLRIQERQRRINDKN